MIEQIIKKLRASGNDAEADWLEGQEPVNRERLYHDMLNWRGIYPDYGDIPCKCCGGAGVRSYGSTSTWRGGVGGQAITTDICDKCWGSGNADKPWANLRKVYATPVPPCDTNSLSVNLKALAEDVRDAIDEKIAEGGFTMTGEILNWLNDGLDLDAIIAKYVGK